MKKRLLIVIVLISVLVHLRIVFPVILMHIFNLFLSLIQLLLKLNKPVLQFFLYIFKKKSPVITSAVYCHFSSLQSVPNLLSKPWLPV